MSSRTFFHGTSTARPNGIQSEGLTVQRSRFGGWSPVFLTNNLEAAHQYAELAVRTHGGDPIIFATDLEFSYQPNGTPAPPFSIDDWHTDSGMPGEAWEYDKAIPFDQLRAIELEGPANMDAGLSF